MKRRSSFTDRPEVIAQDARKHMKYIDDEIIPLLLPLQKTKYGILGIIGGHHYYQLSPVLSSPQYIANELARLSKKKVHFLGEMSSFLDFRFRSSKRSLRIVGHVQHGAGGGSTKASSLQKLDQAFQSFEADFYMRAHSCQRVASLTDRLYPKMSKENGNPEILHNTVAYLNLGAATKGYEISRGPASYIENQMMRPTTCGWGSISFHFRKALKDEDVNQGLKFEMKVIV